MNCTLPIHEILPELRDIQQKSHEKAWGFMKEYAGPFPESFLPP
ncbi:MAG: hypothetical protein ACYC2W_01705 [Desulfurivibrionaceae bacterium]